MGAGRGADPSPGARRLGQSLAPPPPLFLLQARIAKSPPAKSQYQFNAWHDRRPKRPAKRVRLHAEPGGPWAVGGPLPDAARSHHPPPTVSHQSQSGEQNSSISKGHHRVSYKIKSSLWGSGPDLPCYPAAVGALCRAGPRRSARKPTFTTTAGPGKRLGVKTRWQERERER